MKPHPAVEPIELTHRPSAPHEVLLYYDGPLLLWLPVKGRRLLAYAFADCGPVVGEPFIVAELTETAAARVEAGTLSWRQAVLTAQAHYLLPDYYAQSLTLIRLPTPLPQALLPGAD